MRSPNTQELSPRAHVDGVFLVAPPKCFRFCVIVSLFVAVGVSAPGFAATFAGNIVLGRPTATSISANLLAPTALTGYLEFGILSGSYQVQTAPTPFAANVPQVVDMGPLQPNTRYYYRLRFATPPGTTYDATPEYSFMTQRAPGSTFTFCIQGDSHPERLHTEFDPNLYTRTLQTVAADKPDFYMTIGDDFSIDTINQANPYAVTAAQVTDRYTIQRPYLGIVGASAPVFLVNGNHEQAARYLLDGTPNNVAVWAQNARNSYYAEPGPDSFYAGNTEQVPFIGLLRNHYAWTWGDALFVTIDPYWGSPVCVDNPFYGGAKRSNLWDITHGDPQYDWLKATLEQSHAKYKFVFAHHVMGTQRGGIEVASKYEWGGQNANGTPGFTANRPAWAYPIHQLMVNNHVTIFFQGHDHIWVHQQLDGVIYQTLSEPADPNYSLFNADAYSSGGDMFPNSGYTRVTVAPSGLKLEYVRTYLPADEGPGKVSGTTVFSYTVPPRADSSVGSSITPLPAAQTVASGGSTSVSVGGSQVAGVNLQWQFNGGPLAGATSPTLPLVNVQPANAGLYTAVTMSGNASATSDPAIVGLATTSKVTGAGTEIAHGVFVASNGNTFDQVLLSGAAATVTAEPGKITRTSFVDLTNDIVQVEFSGAGTLSLVLDNPTGPALPVNYIQATNYLKGHAGIVITGANESTNVSVFSVGRVTAVNQAIFRSDVTYDSLADLAFIAISSANGKFGGLRAANANFYATKGLTGVYAPGVEFTGPVYVGNISAFNTASPVLMIGSSPDTRIAGGDLAQANGKPVQVSGLVQLKSTAGTDSQGRTLPAKNNRAVLLLPNGADVTTQLVAGP